MDFSRYTNRGAIAQFLLLFFLLLSLNSVVVVVKAQDDKTIVRTICSQTLEPEACSSCVLADTTRTTSNVTEMVHSILFCLYSEATFAHQAADHLFHNTTAAVRLKKVFHVCTDTLFSAANSLMVALMKLECEDYEEVKGCARAARSDLFQCVSAFIKCGGYVPIPTELVNHMVNAKRLFEVAQFMFLRL